MRCITIAGGMALAACASMHPSAPSVSELEASLAAVGQVIASCYTVPQCRAIAPRAQIKLAFDEAYTSVTLAQAQADAGGQPGLGDAVAKVGAVQALVTKLPVPTGL